MFARSIADSGSSQNALERASWPRPVLTNKRAAIDANERTQHQPDDDHVIELASDRNEVGHEIERQGQIADQADQQEFATTRHARIRKQPPHQQQAVRNEARKRTGVRSSPRHNEGADRHHPDEDQQTERNQEPAPPTHSANVAAPRKLGIDL